MLEAHTAVEAMCCCLKRFGLLRMSHCSKCLQTLVWPRLIAVHWFCFYHVSNYSSNGLMQILFKTAGYSISSVIEVLRMTCFCSLIWFKKAFDPTFWLLSADLIRFVKANQLSQGLWNHSLNIFEPVFNFVYKPMGRLL